MVHNLIAFQVSSRRPVKNIFFTLWLLYPFITSELEFRFCGVFVQEDAVHNVSEVIIQISCVIPRLLLFLDSLPLLYASQKSN